MEEYLKLLIKRREFLEHRKNSINSDLASIIKELEAVEELIRLHGGISIYPRKGSIKEKVLFILNEIKEGSYKDIEKSIESHGDNVNSTSLKITCASLSRNEEIKVKSSSGRTNIYTL